jgi:guanine deaminase
MTHSTQIWMSAAIDLAVENVALGHGGPFGAVIVREGKIIATGVNQVTSLNDPTAHAEVSAIRSACTVLGDYRLSDCTLFTSCEPCPMCLAAAYWARLDAVYFAATHQDAAAQGFDDSFLYDELCKPLSERRLPIHHLAHPNATLAFERWSQASDKISY